MSSSVARPSSLSIHFDSVIINEDATGSFFCDEEPHMLGPERGPLGYYPLQLGQVFHHDITKQKYEIVRKLGWGQHSSVWLARIVSEDRYVAIKVFTVNASYGVMFGHYHEFGVYNRFYDFSAGNGRNHPGIQHCAIPESSMEQRSVHGVHVCTITEPFGTTIYGLQRTQPDSRFPLHVVKNIARQTLLALDLLHSLQVIHADLKPENLFVQLDVGVAEISNFLRDHPSETYPPRFEPSIWDGPIITVKTQPLPNLGLLPSLENLSVRVGDFGGAICADEKTPTTLVVTPASLRAPEMMLGGVWSLPVDIWAFGIMIFGLLTGKSLFPGESTASRIASVTERLGPFPSEFLRGCEKCSEFFDGDGNLLHVEGAPIGSLEQCLRSEIKMGEQDFVATLAFLRKCLSIDPNHRATASQLLKDEWLCGAQD